MANAAPTRSSRSPSPTPSTRSTPRCSRSTPRSSRARPSFVCSFATARSRTARTTRPPERWVASPSTSLDAVGPAARLKTGVYPQTAAYLETVTPKMVAEVEIWRWRPGKGNGRRRRRRRARREHRWGNAFPRGNRPRWRGTAGVTRGTTRRVRGVRGFRRGRGVEAADQRDARGEAAARALTGATEEAMEGPRRKKNTCAQPRVERDETAVSAVSGPTTV